VDSLLMVCLFLSLVVVAMTLMVLHLKRQLRGSREILKRILRKEFYHAEDD
jgi:hypothetical protein